MVLSGNDILMTETGSLGPIDAQVKIGRSVGSAYAYIEWVENKQKQAKEEGKLNQFDAIMVAQIPPQELVGTKNTLDFAQKIVIDWLVKYKFNNWDVTETRKIPVTEKKKIERAHEIADAFIKHSHWKSHARSIKRQDVEKLGLKVENVDNDPELSDIVYRI